VQIAMTVPDFPLSNSFVEKLSSRPVKSIGPVLKRFELLLLDADPRYLWIWEKFSSVLILNRSACPNASIFGFFKA